MAIRVDGAGPAVKLLIAERDSVLGGRRRAGGADELCVFVPSGSGSPGDLALRTLRHIAAVERSGQRIVRAVIGAGPRSCGQVLAARTLMARAVIAHQCSVGAGELIFTCTAGPGSRVQHELLALAGTLTSELGTSRIAVRVLLDCRIFKDEAGRARIATERPLAGESG